MRRIVQPEILDSLPEDHPDARKSRRDLRRINLIMGNHRWLARSVSTLVRPGERVLELGAGTGELGRRLALRGVEVDGLDLAGRPDGWPRDRAWHTADIHGFGGYGQYPVVIANLILHHFNDSALFRLGETLGRTARVIVASEPSRSRLSLALVAGLFPLFGANRVTRHDAPASIAAGFQGDELPRALGLSARMWDVKCHASALGAFRMIALRR